MWRVSLIARGTYQNSRIAEQFQLLVTKREVEFDYIAVDASALVGTALRLAKNVTTEQRRHKEVSRHVTQSLQQLLKTVRCKRSLLITMDGPETLMKAQRTRTSNVNRKLENRLLRLPGTPIMQAVEERLVRIIPDRQIFPCEVVFSGTCVNGCVEQKMSAWALDLSCRDTFNGSQQSLCLIGSSELYLNVLGLTPFYNISSIVQSNSDYKQLRLSDMLLWLGIAEKATGGDSAAVARMRTDCLLLYVLCHGAAATDLVPLSGIQFAEVMKWYFTKLSTGGSPDKDGSGSGYITSDGAGNTILLDAARLEAVLSASTRKSFPPRWDNAADSYLNNVLQTHSLLCLGKISDLGHVPTTGAIAGSAAAVNAAPTPMQFLAHLKFMMENTMNPPESSDQRKVRPDERTQSSDQVRDSSAVPNEEKEKPRSVSLHPVSTGPPHTESSRALSAAQPQSAGMHAKPLTAAEYTILSYSQPAAVESAVHQYVGATPKLEVCKLITTSDIHTARQLTQSVLTYVDPQKAHKCLCHSPSYCWLQNEKSKLWRFEYVDVGVVSEEQCIRRKRNAEVGVSMSVEVASDGPSKYCGDSQQWVPIPRFPCGEEVDLLDSNAAAEATLTTPSTLENESSDAEVSAVKQPVESASMKSSRKPATPPKTLKLLTWNVMFDRYSGKPTPLGMPGIDWCSPQRYPVLSKCIEAENADVVGMQEVEPAFWEFLSVQPWMRENYYFSCGLNSAALSPWGVLMLVHKRLRVENITHLNVPAWKGHVSLLPVVTLQMAHAPVSVAAAHLLAPYTKSHETARTGQDNALRQRLHKNISGDCVAMGDYNDWPTNEFLMPPETRFVDCWPLVCPNDPGKTMDETNTFCKLKIEEIFFGRSDKMFLRSARLKPTEAHLVGTKTVNEENNNNAAPAYLFPSDHYGVSMSFALR